MFDREAAAAWADPGTYATPLVVLLVDRYGTEALNWAPGTITAEIRQDSGAELPDENLDRLMAGAHILTQPDRFFADAPTFEFLCRVLHSAADSEGDFRYDSRELADAADCLWGMAEAALLAPGEHPYGDAVKEYVRTAVREFGLTQDDGWFKAVGVPDVFPTGSYDYSADPDVAAATEKGREYHKGVLLNVIRGGVTKLLTQVAALPLRHGDAKSWALSLQGKMRLVPTLGEV